MAKYKQEIKKRIIIERIIGHLKGYRHLRRWLYRDPVKQKIQLVLAAIVQNMEQMVRIAKRERQKGPLMGTGVDPVPISG